MKCKCIQKTLWTHFSHPIWQFDTLLTIINSCCCHRNKVIIQQLQDCKAENERTIARQNELIKTKGDELEAQKNQNNSIITEVKKLEEVAKQKELEHDKQKMQQELNKKKEESQKQMEHSAENVKVQKEIKELLGERFVF